MFKYFDYLLDFIYPKKCIFCNEPVPFGEGESCVCDICSKTMPIIKENICKKCGIENTERPGSDYCYRCLHTKYAFERNYAVFKYNDVGKAIKKFKYDKIKYLGIGFAILMKDYVNNINTDIIKDIDIIVSVPVSKKKFKERGFNHVEIIVNKFSELVNLPCDNSNLIRIKDTPPQSTLSFKERKENVKGAFAVVNKEAFKNKKVLLIDDIFTTGSTVDECAREMIQSGAKEVRLFTFSIATGKDD